MSSALRRGVLVPSVFALLAIAVFLSLGTWQLTRRAWKEELIASLNHRLAAEPQPLPNVPLNPADAEFRRVAARVEFLPGKEPSQRDQEARVYTSGSALRDDIKSPGYFVFSPARLSDGRIVVINRGYVANPQPNASTPAAPRPTGPIDIGGVLRWPEKAGWFDNDYSGRDDLWFVRDVQAMAARNGWGAVMPYYIEQEAPVPSGGVPRPGKLKVNLRNEHLQYAITWYALGAIVAILSVIWLRGRRRDLIA